MKITYLIRSTDDSGNSILLETNKSEWTTIIAANKSLPSEKRRYFISDCIVEGKNIDMMMIEVSYEDHLKWNREHMHETRNCKEGVKYQHLSLDAPLGDATDCSLGDIINDPFCLESYITENQDMHMLRVMLRGWNIWAEDMLDLYLDGKEKNSAGIIAEKFGVTERVGRKYKNQFKLFLQNYFFQFRF